MAESEAATGYRNQALANFMKSFGRIDHGVAQVLDLYFHQCALSMSCLQLARAAGYLCSDGAHPLAAGQAALPGAFLLLSAAALPDPRKRRSRKH